MVQGKAEKSLIQETKSHFQTLVPLQTIVLDLCMQVLEVPLALVNIEEGPFDLVTCGFFMWRQPASFKT